MIKSYYEFDNYEKRLSKNTNQKCETEVKK